MRYRVSFALSIMTQIFRGAFSMIRVLLVDNQNLICEGLKATLSLESDMQVVGTAINGEKALEQVALLQPDVVLMELQIPVIDGREATRIISQRFPKVKVLVLSTFDDQDSIADSICAGAKGYLLKDMPSEELAQVIRAIARGYTQMGPGLMEKLIASSFSNLQENPSELSKIDLSQLTPREQEVLELMVFGLTNRDIAQQLYIAEGTVKTYITHLLNRFNLSNRTQLAIYANATCKKQVPLYQFS
jgi:DNA-binding NarL/FixJ family response regulator